MTLAAAERQPDESAGPTLREHVAEEVRAWMARRRISGAQLARDLGRSQTFVQKRLDGRQSFDMDDLEAVARILDVPARTFLPDYSPNSATTSPRNPVGSHRHLTVVPPIPVAHDETSDRADTDVTQERAA